MLPVVHLHARIYLRRQLAFLSPEACHRPIISSLLTSRWDRQVRSYASKPKGSKHKLPKSTPSSSSLAADDSPVTLVIAHGRHKHGEVIDELIPGGHAVDGDPIAFELEKVERKMKSIVEWFKREGGNIETRGSGRVTPSLLDGISVKLDGDGGTVKLDEIATVGVREGSVLVVTLFDETMIKAVKIALSSDRHGFVPQGVDARTIRIPIPRPTAETRQELIKAASNLAEDARIKIRSAREAGNKAFKAEGIISKKDPAYVKCQKLTDTYVEEVDAVLQGLRKSLG